MILRPPLSTPHTALLLMGATDRLAGENAPGSVTWPGQVVTVEASIEEMSRYLEALYEDDMEIKVRNEAFFTLYIFFSVILGLAQRPCVLRRPGGRSDADQSPDAADSLLARVSRV